MNWLMSIEGLSSVHGSQKYPDVKVSIIGDMKIVIVAILLIAIITPLSTAMKRTLNTTINRSESGKNDEQYTPLVNIEKGFEL